MTPQSTASVDGSLVDAVAIPATTLIGAPLSIVTFYRGTHFKARLTCLRCGWAVSHATAGETLDLEAWARPLADTHEAKGCRALAEQGHPLELLLDGALRSVLQERTDGFLAQIHRVAMQPTADTEIVIGSDREPPAVLDCSQAGVVAQHHLGAHAVLAAHDAMLREAASTMGRAVVTAVAMNANDIAEGARRWYFFLPELTIVLESAPQPGSDRLALSAGDDAGPSDPSVADLWPINHVRLAIATTLGCMR